MEDDHVDRPGVEVRQRMKLTGTNSSIGLIIHIAHTHPTLCPHGSPLRGRLREGAGWPAARSRVLGLRPGSRRRRRREQRRGKTRCESGIEDHLLPYSPTALLPSNPSFSTFMPFADLVVLAGWLHPFPFRTRP